MLAAKNEELVESTWPDPTRPMISSNSEDLAE